MVNLDTEEGVQTFCSMKRAEMEACWAREGRFEVNGFSFGAYILATRKIVGGEDEGWPTEPLEHVEAVKMWLPSFAHVLVPEHQHTAMFAHIIRESVAKNAAVGTIFMGEAWMASTPRPDMTEEEVLAWRATLPADMGEFEAKREGLFMSLEHKTIGRHFWRNFIAHAPSRLVGWEHMGAPAVGRLVNLGAVVAS